MKILTLAIIPARYASSRFPGKPLIDLKGKPMIQRVWEQAMKARSVDAVAVATDDLRIKRVVEAFGGIAIMTPTSCASGTDRIAIAAKKFKDAVGARRAVPLRGTPKIIINVQGDEPLLPPAMIDQLVSLIKKSKAPMATLSRPLERGEYTNPNNVKVVTDKAGRALYFSRASIPYDRDAQVGARRRAPQGSQIGLHVGLYAYQAGFLQQLAKFKPTSLEQLEKLEQLRVLENGVAIAVGQTRLHSVAVDTPGDAARVRRLLNHQK